MSGLRTSFIAGIASLIAALCAVAPAGSAERTEQAILFVRDGNLWSMDGRGGLQRQLTTNGSGHVSVSLTGTIVMDRFLPYGPPKPLSDLNLYRFSVDDPSTAKLTSDNLSKAPAVSPDGSRIAYQKFAWKGERNYLGEGRGIWLIDTATGAQRELAGIAPPSQELRQARLGSNRPVAGEASTWTDNSLRWSIDSRSLIFARSYTTYGSWTYWVDLSNPEAPEVVVYPGYECGRDLNGSRMLCFDNGAMSLVVYDFRTGQTRTLAKNVFVGDAKYSPDGQRVAFVVQSGVHLTQSDLWTVDSGGQNLKKISNTPLYDIDEVWWTADGQRLVFERYYSQEMRSEVWSVASDGSDLRRLAENAKDPRPTRAAGPARGEIVLPVSTLWGQDALLYVDTKIPACGQVPADAGNMDLVGVKVGCPAVAVGQLINYWYEMGSANGWLDTLLQGVAVYPRPWSFGGMGRAACTHPGFGAADSYRNANWSQLKQFLWHVGIGLDTDYDLSISGLKAYPSERLEELICPPQICGTLHPPEKLASLLEERFRFKVIKGPSNKLTRLDDASDVIKKAIDEHRPVLLMLSEGLGGAGHVALIQGYRKSFSGGLNQYDFQVNFGWGPRFALRWVPGGGSFQTGKLTWKQFWVIDVAPVTAAAAQPSLTAAIHVGQLEDASIAGGCGCYFSPASGSGQVTLDQLLFYSDTECNAWMNIDGRDVKLTAEGRTRAGPDFPDARCDAEPVKYSAARITVRVERKVTRECPPEPTECEVTDYDVTLTVEKGAATQAVKAQGTCGC